MRWPSFVRSAAATPSIRQRRRCPLEAHGEISTIVDRVTEREAFAEPVPRSWQSVTLQADLAEAGGGPVAATSDIDLGKALDGLFEQ